MRIIFVIYCLLIPTLFFSCRSSLPTGVEVEEVNYLMEKGDSCRQADNEENAIIFYYRSLELAKQINVPMLEATASSRLAIIYLYRELYYDALDLFRKAVSIYALAGEDAEQAVALRNIGRTHLMLHHSDSIACYYEQAIEVACHLEDKELLRSISAELEAIYSKGGFYHFSSRLMLKFLDSVSDEAFSSLIAGESYISMRNTEQARVRLKKATQTSDMYICSSAYQLLYEIEKKAKRPEIAVEYAESYIQCRDSLDKQLSASSTIRALGQNYEKERLKSENQRLQNEQLRRRMHYLIILSLSFCLLVAGLVWYYREKWKKEKVLAEVMQQLRDNESQIESYTAVIEKNKRIISDLKGDQRRNAALLREEQSKSTNYENLKSENLLLMKQLHILHSDREEILQRLQMGSTSSISSQRIAAFTQFWLLKSEPYYGIIETQEEWNRVFELVDMFYGDISAKLNVCELLNEHDRRVCYLLHAGLDNSTLGILFNIDNTSVTKSKQRIKKKLGLGPNDSLEAFFAENKR